MSTSASVFRIARLAAMRSARIAPSSSRCFSRTALVGEPKKPSIKAIAELRKLMPGTSMIKAKEALLASRPASSPDEDSIEAALEWLEADRRKSGAKKADKVAGRQAREGIVAVTVLSDGLPSAVELKGQLKDQAVSAGIGATGAAAGGIVEVNCETDFVAKNDVFTQSSRTSYTQSLSSPLLQTLPGQRVDSSRSQWTSCSPFRCCQARPRHKDLVWHPRRWVQRSSMSSRAWARRSRSHVLPPSLPRRLHRQMLRAAPRQAWTVAPRC